MPIHVEVHSRSLAGRVLRWRCRAWVGLLLCCGLLSCAWAQSGAAQAAPGPGPRFAILEYEVEGNTVLSVPQIEKAVMPFMGESRQLDDVEKARTALEKAYQSAGYLTVFVDVPEQRVDGGVVRLRVTEGRVERLSVTGSRYYDQGVIRDGVTELKEGNVPNFNEVQKQIAVLSREERQLQPVLRPGIEPGTVQAELKVDDKLPLSGSVELNNRHAPNTVPWRLAGTVRYDNLFQRDHGLSISGVIAPEDPSESEVLVANYAAPLGNGSTLLGYAVWSNSQVAPLGGVSVLGKGIVLGTRWLHAFYAGDSSHSLSLGVDYKNLDQRTDVDEVNAVTNPLLYMPFQLGYNGSWSHAYGQTSLSTSFVFGVKKLFLRYIDCTEDSNVGPIDQFQCSRNGASGDFAYWRGDARHAMPAFGGAIGARLGWQLASEPLVPGEQFALGGAETVRGYLEAEVVGDNGVLVSIEWRSKNLLDTAPDDLWRDLSVLTFVDAAQAYLLKPEVGQMRRTPLLGSGFGLRMRANPYYSAELDIAWPFYSTAFTTAHDPRLYFRLLAQF